MKHHCRLSSFSLLWQLERVVISLEVMLRSSAPQATPTTLRAYFDSPGWALSDWRFGIPKKKKLKFFFSYVWGSRSGPGGVGSCKVYAPVNPHTKYMRIYGTVGEGKRKKMTKIICRSGPIDFLLVVLWVGLIRDHFWKFQRKCSSCLNLPRRNT